MFDDAEHPILGSASQAPDVGFDTTELRWLEANKWMATPWDCIDVILKKTAGIPQLASVSAKRQMFGMSFFASSLQVMLCFQQV